MAFILKSLGTNRNLVKFTQFTCLLNSKEELSALLWGKILPVEIVGKSQFCTLESDMFNITFKDDTITKAFENTRFFRRKELEAIAEKLKSVDVLTNSQAISYLRCCDNITLYEPPDVRLQLTKLIWGNLKERGVTFDIFYYNLLLRVYLQNEHKFSCIEFLSEIVNEGFTPNLVTYRRLLRASCQQGNLNEATYFLQKFQELDLPINEHIFDSLILGYCQIDDIDNALGVIEVMKQKNLQPTSETFTTLMCFYARKGRIEEMHNILFDCENDDLMLSDMQFLEIIYNLALSGNLEQIKYIYNKILRSPKFFSNRINIINRLINKKMDKEAVEIYKYVFDEDEKINFIIFKHFFLEYYIEVRTFEDIVKLCEYLVPPGNFNYAASTVAKKLIMKQDLEKFHEFVLLTNNINFPLRSHYFLPFIIHASKAGNKELLHVLNVMQQLKIKPSLQILSAVIKYYDFKKSVNEDTEKLEKFGLSGSSLFFKIFLKLLEDNEFEKATLITSFKRLKFKQNIMVSYLSDKSASYMGEILYNFLHDVYLDVFSKLETENFETKNSKALTCCVSTLNSFIDLTAMQEPKVVIPFLKALSEQPVSIDIKTASLIKNKFHSDPEIKQLADKLCKSIKGFVNLNKNVLRKKSAGGLVICDLQNPITEEKLSDPKENFKRPGKNDTEEEVFKLMALNVNMNRIGKAMTLLKNLKSAKQNNFETLKLTNNEKFAAFVKKLLDDGKENALRKIIRECVNLDLIDYYFFNYLMIKYHIERNDIEKAVDFYCKHCSTKKMLYILEFLVRYLIDTHSNPKLLDQVIESSINSLGKQNTLKTVFFEYVHKGLLEEAKEFLETKEIFIDSCTLEKHCFLFNQQGNEAALLVLLKLGADYFNINYIVKHLLSLYMEKKKYKETKNLWLYIQEKNIKVHGHIEKTLNNYLFRRNNFLDSNQKKIYKQPKKSDQLDFETKQNPENIFIKEAIEDFWSDEKAQKEFNDFLNLIEKGKFNKIFENCSKTKIKSLLEKCVMLLKEKKAKEYLRLLQKLLEKRPDSLSILIFKKLEEFLNESEWKKVMEIAINALKTGNCASVKKILGFCLDKPELLETLKDEFNYLLDSDLCVDIIERDSVEVREFLQDKNINQNARSIVYSILIQSGASKYYEKAVNEGIQHLLNKKSLQSLLTRMNHTLKRRITKPN